MAPSPVANSGSQPILPGFYPDPSICRVGTSYYLVNSTFEYYPGVPVWTSTDLVEWRQVGNVFERASQMAPSAGDSSTGIFAPTIRHHNGLFWLITSIVDGPDPEQVILHSEHPGGPWSDPVTTDGVHGIDPDLAWDGDDCYLTWARKVPGATTEIAQCRVDLATGTPLEEPRRLWSGTGMRHPEGPHLHRKDGWWYLLIAEGGTEAGHSVSIARSRRPDGPFGGAPGNPILTHRSLAAPVQNTGHSDLVQRADGSWALVYLGVRPRGVWSFHVNGRETFVADVRWEDDWPVIEENTLHIPPAVTAFDDDFAGSTLDPRWIMPGDYPERHVVKRDDGGVLLRAEHGSSAPLLCVRARDEYWTVTADVESSEGARLVVRIDDLHAFGVEVRDGTYSGFSIIGGTEIPTGSIAGASARARLMLRSTQAPSTPYQGGPDRLEASVIIDGDHQPLGNLDGRFVSTEVAGGFTGRVIGVQPIGDQLILRRFAYQPENL
ncbi:glycoside hydrolase family 43 protein [Microbacterium foliorum]|nr:glycoside hydrolase family 43 protein [Microbacterium foliorum]